MNQVFIDYYPVKLYHKVYPPFLQEENSIFLLLHCQKKKKKERKSCAKRYFAIGAILYYNKVYAVNTAIYVP